MLHTLCATQPPHGSGPNIVAPLNKRELHTGQARDFADRVLTSRHWLNAARELLETVRLVEPVLRQHWRDFENSEAPLRPLSMHRTFLLLVGLTVENLLKSRIVKYKRRSLRSEMTKTGKIPKILTGNHNLTAYAAAAKVTPTTKDQRVLSRLSRAVRWSGRYPFPSSYRNWDTEIYSANDIDDTKQFVNDLFNRLHAQQIRPINRRMQKSDITFSSSRLRCA